MTRSAPFLTSFLMILTACGTDKASTNDDSSIGHDSETGDSNVGPCTTQVMSVEPADGAADVYYHHTITVSFDGDGGSAEFSLLDASGVDVPVTATFTEGNVQAVLTADLEPVTAYTLTTSVCGSEASSSFTTNALGSPLDMDPADLIGATYEFRLSDADITEPAFLDLIAGTYLTVPILIGVDSADSTSIDMLGGLGYETTDSYAQDTTLPSWDFPVADFTTQPFFHAQSPLITIMYGTTAIPIEQFNLSGTFAADGSAIEEGYVTGIGDSRYMATLVGKPADDLSAVCDLAASLGVNCTECADGEPYCLYIVAENITAERIDGLTLTEVLP